MGYKRNRISRIHRVSIAELTIRNLKSQVAEPARTLRIMIEILKFIGNQQFPKNHWGCSLYMTGVENFFIYWPGRHNMGPGRQSQQNYRPGEPPGHISPGHLDRVYIPSKLLSAKS